MYTHSFFLKRAFCVFAEYTHVGHFEQDMRQQALYCADVCE